MEREETGKIPVIRTGDWDHNDQKREYVRFWTEMYPHAVRAVESSFLDPDGSLRGEPKRGEVKLRVDMAKDLIGQMRSLGWSKPRIIDTIVSALRAKVIGLEFNLEAMNRRGSWM